MVTWGDAAYGGDCSAVQDQLAKVQLLQDKLSSMIKQIAAQEKALSDQYKTDLGQAQIVKQHADDLAGLDAAVNKLAALIGSSFVGDDINALAKSLGVLENKSRVLTAIEQNASQMDERVFLVEQSIDSVNAFRQDTNRSLDQLQKQIRNLAYSE